MVGAHADEGGPAQRLGVEQVQPRHSCACIDERRQVSPTLETTLLGTKVVDWYGSGKAATRMVVYG